MTTTFKIILILLNLLSVDFLAYCQNYPISELKIINVFDNELPEDTIRHINNRKEITLDLLLKDKDNINYKFDSIWIFMPRNDNNSQVKTIIFKHIITSSEINLNKCKLTSFIITSGDGVNRNRGIITTEELYPMVLNVKITPYKTEIKDKLRLYYTYKGKWQVARFRGKIIYTPTEEYRYKRKHAHDNDSVGE
jgi:hypothetical protein